MFENNWFTSNTYPANYNATTLAMIKSKKHRRIADLLLQSGVVTRNCLSNGYSFSSGLFQTEHWLRSPGVFNTVN